MKLRALTLLTLLFLPLASHAQRAPLIGVFEAAASGKGDNLGQPGVRVLFYQAGQEWRSYNATCHDQACLQTITHLFPLTTTWTLVKDNKPIAKVTAEIPAAFHFYSEIGVQAITNPGSVANLEPRSNANQLDQFDQPHTIIATNFSALTDPENWQPATPFPIDLTRAQQKLHSTFPHPPNCDAAGKLIPRSHPWTYADTDIKLTAGYTSHKNWRLIQLTLGGYLCDGPPDPAFFDQWYAVSPGGEITHLGHSMHFTAAADFAHDGHTELLFEIQNENNGGYKLFYDNFTHQSHAAITHH